MTKKKIRRLIICSLWLMLLVSLAGITAIGADFRREGNVLLNDLGATPGNVLTKDLEKLCVPGYAAKVRNVPKTLKLKVREEYGVSPERCNGRRFEIDHLISLEIGGSNDIKNLWPQPYTPPGAKEKDRIENWLHKEVCGGQDAAGSGTEGYQRELVEALPATCDRKKLT